MILRDQAQRLLLADLRIALVVGLVEFDLGATDLGSPAVAPSGNALSSGCAVLTIPAPSVTASLADWPALAAFPVSG